MEFEWFFSEEDFDNANKSKIEDDIYGWVCVKTTKEKYLIDIHKEYYSSKNCGYDLEVYTECNDGGHGYWLGYINDIRSAKSLERFKNRAEKLLEIFINEKEN